MCLDPRFRKRNVLRGGGKGSNERRRRRGEREESRSCENVHPFNTVETNLFFKIVQNPIDTSYGIARLFLDRERFRRSGKTEVKKRCAFPSSFWTFSIPYSISSHENDSNLDKSEMDKFRKQEKKDERN